MHFEEDIMNKTMFEKIGDIMLSTGKRSLIFLAILVVLILPVLTPLMEIAIVFLILIGIPVFWSLLSFIPLKKSRLVNSFCVTLKDGTVVPCAVMKRQHYLRNPFWLVSFLTPFCFIPLKTQYYLLIDVNQKKIDKKVLVSDAFLEIGIINTIELSHKKAKAVQANPQILSNELEKYLYEKRVTFNKFIAPCVKYGIAEVLYSGVLSTVVRVSGTDWLFKHSGNKDKQMCLSVADWVDVKNDKENNLCFYEAYGSDNAAFLKALGCFNGNTVVRAFLSKTNVKTQQVIENAVRERGYDNRVVVDEARIGRILFRHRAKGNAIAEGIFLFLFIQFSLAVISCMAMGAFDVALFGAVFVPGLLIGFIVNHVIKKKKRKTFTKDDYEIEEVVCTKSEIAHVDEIDTVHRKLEFSDGGKFNSVEDIEEGDLCYVIYTTREKEKKNYYFSAVTSKFTPSLVSKIKRQGASQKTERARVVK